jgi:hypothetical protein
VPSLHVIGLAPDRPGDDRGTPDDPEHRTHRAVAGTVDPIIDWEVGAADPSSGEEAGMNDNSGGFERNSYSGMSGLADSKVSETDRRARGMRGLGAGHWPSGWTVVRVVGLAIGAIVVLAWVLTAVNS